MKTSPNQSLYPGTFARLLEPAAFIPIPRPFPAAFRLLGMLLFQLFPPPLASFCENVTFFWNRSQPLGQASAAQDLQGRSALDGTAQEKRSSCEWEGFCAHAHTHTRVGEDPKLAYVAPRIARGHSWVGGQRWLLRSWAGTSSQSLGPVYAWVS